MPTATYIALATLTVSGTEAEIEFGSIPNTYRDLVIQAGGSLTVDNTNVFVYLNSDRTNGNYSTVTMFGESGVAGSTSNNDPRIWTWGTAQSSGLLNIMDYSATDKQKTILSRSGASPIVRAFATRWANTNAVTTVVLVPQSASFNSGTVTLYGIVS